MDRSKPLHFLMGRNRFDSYLFCVSLDLPCVDVVIAWYVHCDYGIVRVCSGGKVFYVLVKNGCRLVMMLWSTQYVNIWLAGAQTMTFLSKKTGKSLPGKGHPVWALNLRATCLFCKSQTLTIPLRQTETTIELSSYTETFSNHRSTLRGSPTCFSELRSHTRTVRWNDADIM